LHGLLCEGFAAEPPILPEGTRLDEILSPIDLIHVVDADSSQTRVIETVRAGRNLVVQGPPGTGKSQTITNIIAAAVHDGQSVLFVAEKMAALTVVHERLKAAGLDDICLELHSQAASKASLRKDWTAPCKRPAASSRRTRRLCN
jgi:primosomal protein N'